jgi:RhtB (resistance to homoserine/threonine) family protein
VSNALAYTLVAALLVITPGPDTALVTRNALALGRRGALMTALGVEAGLLVWSATSVVGLAAVLAASAMAFTLVKLAGAAYLVYLGVRSLLALRDKGIRSPAPGAQRIRAGAAFRHGVLSNLLNPKIAVFFTSIIPQFVVPGPSAWLDSALLAGIYVLLCLVWLVTYSLLASLASDFLAQERVKKTLAGVTGLVCVGFGLRLATETA